MLFYSQAQIEPHPRREHIDMSHNKKDNDKGQSKTIEPSSKQDALRRSKKASQRLGMRKKGLHAGLDIVASARQERVLRSKLIITMMTTASDRRWPPSLRLLVQNYVNSLVSGDGTSPRGLAAEPMELTQQKFVSACIRMEIPANTLPGQNMGWYYKTAVEAEKYTARRTTHVG